MTQTLLRALAGQLERGGSAGAADGDYVGLGCGELDHVAQSNGPLRGGGKNGRGRRPNTCDALFSALLRRPSIRPRTFPSSLPHPSCLPSTFSSSHLLLLPSPRSSLRPLPQPPPPQYALIPPSFTLCVLLSRSLRCFPSAFHHLDFLLALGSTVLSYNFLTVPSSPLVAFRPSRYPPPSPSPSSLVPTFARTVSSPLLLLARAVAHPPAALHRLGDLPSVVKAANGGNQHFRQ